MAFTVKSSSYYSSENAEKLLRNESTYIVGLQIETQYEYKDDKRTDKVIGYQIWIATDTHNPFKVKFLPDNKPNLSEFNIGEKISFDKLEAIQIKSNAYFRATGIHKA